MLLFMSMRNRFVAVWTAVLLLVPLGAAWGENAGSRDQNYWKYIELVDGQVLHGFVVDSVKGKTIIQLSTRDFISLADASIKRISSEKEKALSLSLAAQVEISRVRVLSRDDPQTWKASWGEARFETTRALRIVQANGVITVGNWIDAQQGMAVVVRPDGSVVGIARDSIVRVSAVGAAESTPTLLPSGGKESADPLPTPSTDRGLLAPFFDAMIDGWHGLNGTPEGHDTAAHRFFFLPSTRTVPAGRLNLSQLEGVVTQATLGVTNQFQIQAGTALPAVVVPDFGNIVQMGVQFGADLGTLEFADSLHLRIGVANSVALRISASPPAPAGQTRTSPVWQDTYLVPSVTASVVGSSSELAFGLAVVKPMIATGTLVIPSLAVEIPLAAHWAFVGELEGSFPVVGSGDTWEGGAAGFRFWNPAVTVDVGVQLTGRLRPIEPSPVWIWPVLNFSFGL